MPRIGEEGNAMQTTKVAADGDRVIKFLFYSFRDYNKTNINQGRERARNVQNARLKSRDRD